VLGNKNAAMLEIFDHDPVARDLLASLLARPSLYDEFLRHLHRQGHAVPVALLERDVTRAHVFTPELVPVFRRIYEDAHGNWTAYETCEELVDLEENMQFWRFRHLKTVERTIGFKAGTGGSSGVGFLRKALDLTFFPELYAVRTEIGRCGPVPPRSTPPTRWRRSGTGSSPPPASSPTWTATRWAARWPASPTGSTPSSARSGRGG